MDSPTQPLLGNSFLLEPEETTPVETAYRRIATAIPAPESIPRLRSAADLFPQVNCYQPPIMWERAEGYQVWDTAGNCWIDFTSTAVAANTGHAHPAIRAALQEYLNNDGLLAQFNFPSDVRIKLAERLRQLAPDGCDKVYFWTVGSEAIEAAFRLARTWGQQQRDGKYHILSHEGDFHGWTYAAHQISGGASSKPWSRHGDAAIHHLPFPWSPHESPDWCRRFDAEIDELARRGVDSDNVAAIFIETMQGWGALPLPKDYVQHLRAWADRHQALIIFDEIQTGFGRTGKWFAHEHYDVRADLVCIGKGVTSSLPLAAVLGPSRILDVLPPAEIASTHAAHPVSCAAALANLDVLENENLVQQAMEKGQVLREALLDLQARCPKAVRTVMGLGLAQAIHLLDPASGEPSRELSRDLIWECVKRGVMLFQVNRPTIKICPPLVIPTEALLEGVTVISDVLAEMTS